MNRKAFTLIELLVVIAIIALLMGILMPALNRVRELGKRIVCSGNIRQMALAWNMYADDNDDKLVNANTHYEDAWVQYEPQWQGEQKLQSITRGAMYSYCPNIDLYKCPAGLPTEVVTYSIPDRLNGHLAIEGATPDPVLKRSGIKNAQEQIAFLDEGRLTASSFTVYYYQERWWDHISAQHGDGTNFSFADGHSEYWSWEDTRTIEIADMEYRLNPGSMDPGLSDPYWGEGNPDLHRVQRGCWGGLGY
jgi:prepilin-type N-terminal cleavage/methylation domain-containing protein/prepilin-type processing-associated H-X9-DG protein